MILRRPNQIVLRMFPTSLACSEFSLQSLSRQHTLTRTIAIFDGDMGISIRGMFPILLQ